MMTLIGIIFLSFTPEDTYAHRSGCHRWHSCPSDRGTYKCGDLGYPCKYPTYKYKYPKSYKYLR